MAKSLTSGERAIREAAAYREAGHAVAAWANSIMLQSLSLRVPNRDLGRNVWNDALRNVDFDWVKTADSSELVERLASVVMAGPVAQKLYASRAPRGDVYALRVSSARKLLQFAGKDRFEKLWKSTETFMKRAEVQRAVQTLGAQLVAESQISAEAATQTIREAMARGSSSTG